LTELVDSTWRRRFVFAFRLFLRCELAPDRACVLCSCIKFSLLCIPRPKERLKYDFSNHFLVRKTERILAVCRLLVTVKFDQAKSEVISARPATIRAS
jgi:hypothetical protein